MIHSRNLGCLKKKSCGNQKEPQLSVQMGHLNMKPTQNPCQSLREGSRFRVLNAAKIVKKSEVTEAATATLYPGCNIFILLVCSDQPPHRALSLA
jgi:hypothetical protein